MRETIKDKKVSIIIPNFNGRELLEKNLPSVIKAKKYVPNRILEVIVVDDASRDDSWEFVKKNFSEVKLIRHRENRGFSASVNTGARAAKGEILVLLNSDVSPTRDFLVEAIRHFNNENVFGVSFHEKGFSWARGKFSDGFIVHESGKNDGKVHETFWISGGSGAFRRRYWMELGGMDEKLFSPFYWEDVDICYRAQKRGWICLWEPNSLVYHMHEATIGKLNLNFRKRIQEKNQLIFIWKNLTSPVLFRKHLLGLLKRIYKNPGYIRILILAISKVRLILKARKKEKKQAKISDESIFARFAS